MLRLHVLLCCTKCQDGEENSLFVGLNHAQTVQAEVLVEQQPENSSGILSIKKSVQKGSVVMELKNLITFLVLLTALNSDGERGNAKGTETSLLNGQAAAVVRDLPMETPDTGK